MSILAHQVQRKQQTISIQVSDAAVILHPCGVDLEFRGVADDNEECAILAIQSTTDARDELG